MQSNAPTAMMRRKVDTSLLIRWSPADDAPVDRQGYSGFSKNSLITIAKSFPKSQPACASPQVAL